MARVALIADIHGNMPALEAVADDIKLRRVDAVYCLGDMVGRGPNGSEAIDWCRENCEVVILGNWENNALRGKRQLILDEIGEERQEYLANLPFYHKMWISGRRMHLLHGRPLVKAAVIWDTAPEEVRLEIFNVIEDEHHVDIVGYADLHRQFKTDFHHNPRTLFNTGSVGSSFNAPMACYAIIEGEVGSKEKSPISFEFISVPYDNQKAVENALNAAWLPSKDLYIKEITEATYQRLDWSSK